MSADAQIELNVAGKTVTLLVEAKRAGYPRDVQQAIWQLRRAKEGHPSSKGGPSCLDCGIHFSWSEGAITSGAYWIL